MILEPLPAVLEYLLAREGFRVEATEHTPAPDPALMLVGDEGGLYVFESRDAAETLERLRLGFRTLEAHLAPWTRSL